MRVSERGMSKREAPIQRTLAPATRACTLGRVPKEPRSRQRSLGVPRPPGGPRLRLGSLLFLLLPRAAGTRPRTGGKEAFRAEPHVRQGMGSTR